MSKTLELALVMKLRDLASSGVLRAQKDIQSSLAQTDRSTANLTRTVGQLGKQRQAAEVLGIRTEQNIQREIQRTQAAYERMAKSGNLSMRELSRAADAARGRIRDLQNEMGKSTLGQKFNAGASLVAGAAAGAYVLSKPINQTMDYGMRLAQMSNTAFTDRNTAGRIAGKAELNAAIVQAVRTGGGTRESAADTLDTLIASGSMSAKDAMGMLPTLMKASTASGADAGQLAQIGIRGMQTFGIKPGEMGNVIDMAIAAGQAGGFELKDMAKWLPQQMAAAKLSGMSGTSGMAKLLAANQAAAITAGTKDEAGNNLVNLLAKINSDDTAKDAAKVGINLPGTLAKARGKGMDSLDAFVGVVDHVVGKNKEYQAIQGKLKGAKGDDRKALLESQADILQGSAIGKIVQDRQALMALVGVMGNRDYMADVQKKTLGGIGSTDKNFEVIASEAGFKTQQAMNEKTFASQTAFENLTPLVGAAADGFTSLGREFPTLTASLVGATTALTALAAAAGVATVASRIGGAGSVGSIAKNVGKAGLGLLGRGAMALGGALFSTTGLAVGAAGAAGYGVGSLINKGIEGTAVGDGIGSLIARLMAAMGNEEAKRAIEVNLHLDGEKITTVVNRRNAATAARN